MLRGNDGDRLAEVPDTVDGEHGLAGKDRNLLDVLVG
jgi:hypothetical protein